MIMNIRNSICNKTYELYNMPFYRFIKRKKLRKNIEYGKSLLKKADIFDLTDNMMEVICTTTDEFQIDHNLIVENKTSFIIILNNGIDITYNPLRHEYLVNYTNESVTFSLYRNTKLLPILKLKWDSIYYDIIDLYINAIEDLAFELLE